VSPTALPDLLTVDDVRNRYRCGARAARRIVREIGALQAAGKLFVRRDALLAWEATNLSVPMTSGCLTPARERRRTPGVSPDLSNLAPDFWMQS
jgi:hypothetical protein